MRMSPAPPRSMLRSVSLLLVGALFIAIFLVTPSQALAATMELNPAQDTVAVGESFDVTVDLSLDGESITGVDALLNFDKNVLQVTSVTKGTVFADVIKSYDNSGGTISISGFNSTDAVTVDGTIATVTFKANAAGSGSVTFDYTAGSKVDSNVAEFQTGNDILEDVTNGTYTVTAATTGTTTTSEDEDLYATTDTGVGGLGDTEESGSPQLPKAGNGTMLMILLAVGLGFIGLGSIQQLKK